MPQLRRCAGLAQKTNPRRFITEIFLADDFQYHGAVQIDVERLVSDAHGTATQLDRFAVFTRHQLVVLKSLRWLFRYCRLDRFFGNGRLGGLNPIGKTLAQQADRAEFHCSRKLVTTTRTGALGLRHHGPSRPSAAIRAESNSTLHRVARNRPARLLAYCCSVARANACSVTVEREIALRNKIPVVGVPWRPVLLMSFAMARFEINSRKPCR